MKCQGRYRALFIMCAIVIVLTSVMLFNRDYSFYEIRENAKKHITKIGGNSEYFPDVIILDETNGSEKDYEQIFDKTSLVAFNRLKIVSANNSSISCKCINQMHFFSNLEYLYLRNCHFIYDKCLDNLVILKKSLKVVDLTGCENLSQDRITELRNELPDSIVIF